MWWYAGLVTRTVGGGGDAAGLASAKSQRRFCGGGPRRVVQNQAFCRTGRHRRTVRYRKRPCSVREAHLSAEAARYRHGQARAGGSQHLGPRRQRPTLCRTHRADKAGADFRRKWLFLYLMNTAQYNHLFSFIWNIANDVLVHAFEKGEYKKIIMPMAVLRRLDILLEPTKEVVLERKKDFLMKYWKDNADIS